MNDPGKEAGSWLALALTAHPHFSLAMMRDVQMDLAPSSPIQTFQKTKAEANTRVCQISLQKLEINSEQIWSLNWDKILKIRRRQGCTFFSWTKLQLKAVGPYIPPISTSQAHSWAGRVHRYCNLCQGWAPSTVNCSMYPRKSWNCHCLSVRLSVGGDCAGAKIVEDNTWSNARSQ